MNNKRNLYNKVKPIINILVVIFRIFPKFLLQFFWDMSKPYSQLPFILLRYLILKVRAKTCEDNVVIGTNVTIKGWNFLELGSNVSIHDNCYIDAGGEISIGSNVSIAHNSTLLSGTHTYLDKKRPIKYNDIIKNGLEIRDDVWIGCGVRVLSGITIHERVIVAAGAVVNRNLESCYIYGGVPVKQLKKI